MGIKTGSVIYASITYISMRCFIAIPYEPDSVVKNLMRIVEEKYGKNVRMVRPENMHLTIEFFEDIQEDVAAQRWDKLNIPAFKDSTFIIKRIGHFPEGKKARVLTLAIDRNRIMDRNQELYNDVRYRWNKRAFKPHITLCRFKSSVYVHDLVKEYEGIEFGKYPAKEILFIKSVLSEEGPQYTVFRRVQLM